MAHSLKDLWRLGLRLVAGVLLGSGIMLGCIYSLTPEGQVTHAGDIDPVDLLRGNSDGVDCVALWRGAFGDTLRHMVPGVTLRVGNIGPVRDGTYQRGEYDIINDLITIDPRFGGAGVDGRALLAHEIGHAYVARHAGELGAIWPRAKALSGTYAANGRREQMAEAYSLAMLWLERVGKDTTRSMDTLRLLERLVPGTTLMVRLDLATPVFASMRGAKTGALRPMAINGGNGKWVRWLNWVAQDGGYRGQIAGIIVRNWDNITE